MKTTTTPRTPIAYLAQGLSGSKRNQVSDADLQARANARRAAKAASK